MATFALQMCDVLDRLPRATAPTGKLQECVLLIEDSEDAMLLVQYALQEHGNGRYFLEWAKDLHDGIDRISKGGIDIVLLDLGLPESCGPATYASVREAAPDLPVLVLTGDTREETEFEITASGVEDYLVKEQVSGSQLLQSIRSALYATKLRQQSKIVEHTLKERAHWSAKR
jgi:DNA-binding response OmpR family regulator